MVFLFLFLGNVDKHNFILHKCWSSHTREARDSNVLASNFFSKSLLAVFSQESNVFESLKGEVPCNRFYDAMDKKIDSSCLPRLGGFSFQVLLCLELDQGRVFLGVGGVFPQGMYLLLPFFSPLSSSLFCPFSSINSFLPLIKKRKKRNLEISSQTHLE